MREHKNKNIGNRNPGLKTGWYLVFLSGQKYYFKLPLVPPLRFFFKKNYLSLVDLIFMTSDYDANGPSIITYSV